MPGSVSSLSSGFIIYICHGDRAQLVGLGIPLRCIAKPSYSGNCANPNVVHKRITSDRTSVINPRSHRTGDLFQIEFRYSRPCSASFNGRAANGRPAKLASSVGQPLVLAGHWPTRKPAQFFFTRWTPLQSADNAQGRQCTTLCIRQAGAWCVLKVF